MRDENKIKCQSGCCIGNIVDLANIPPQGRRHRATQRDATQGDNDATRGDARRRDGGNYAAFSLGPAARNEFARDIFVCCLACCQLPIASCKLRACGNYNKIPEITWKSIKLWHGDTGIKINFCQLGRQCRAHKKGSGDEGRFRGDRACNLRWQVITMCQRFHATCVARRPWLRWRRQKWTVTDGVCAWPARLYFALWSISVCCFCRFLQFIYYWFFSMCTQKSERPQGVFFLHFYFHCSLTYRTWPITCFPSIAFENRKPKLRKICMENFCRRFVCKIVKSILMGKEKWEMEIKEKIGGNLIIYNILIYIIIS